MNTSKILTPVLFALATAAAGRAVAGGDNTYPESPSAPRKLTRAQVEAELGRAAKEGTLEMDDVTYRGGAQASQQKTRADVQRANLASANTGTVPMQHYWTR